MTAALADAVLLLHAALALAIVALLPLTWAGAAAGWRWIRRRWIRGLHLGAIVAVAGLALLGLPCPLTVVEDRLRGIDDPQPGFIERGVEALLYWDAPAALFTVAYLTYAVAVAITWWRVPPDPAATRSP